MGHSATRKTVLVLTAALTLALVLPGAAQAANPATKLTRGVVNITTGWLEIPRQMVERKDDGTVVWYMVHGFLYGTRMGITRTLHGLFDIVTFPIAPYDAPLMEPDTLIAPKYGPDQRTSPDIATSTPTTNITSR